MVSNPALKAGHKEKFDYAVDPGALVVVPSQTMPSTTDALVARLVADIETLFRQHAQALVRETLETALGGTLKGDTVNNGRRDPGRPKAAAPTKRGPGRPPGAKNKPKTTTVVAKPAEPPPAPRFVRLPPKLPRHLHARTKKPAAVGAMLSDGAGPDSGGPVKPIKRVRAS